MWKKAIAFGVFSICFMFPAAGGAVGVDLVFLGVLGNDAPAIEKGFDTRMREALSVNPEYHMLDYLASQDFRQRINFDDFPTVSRRLVEGLRQFSSDSTVFVWASVKGRMIKPVRRWWFAASAVGELTLTLNMYSLRYKEYAFIGDVKASAEKSEGLIFFYPLETGVHISALDQQEITDNLVNQAAFRCADLITAVVKSEKQRVVLGSDSSGMSKYKAASISDMFNVPSVEGANVERSRKRAPAIPPASQSPAPSAATPQKPASLPAASPVQAPAQTAAPAANGKPTAPPSDSAAKPQAKPAVSDTAAAK
jgi:hypothetical protein